MEIRPQGAVYQAGVEAVTGERLPFYLAAATKERVVDLDVFQIPQTTLNLAMVRLDLVLSIMQRLKPDWCRQRPAGTAITASQ